MDFKNLIKAAAKLALSGAVIAAIAAIFLILSEDGSVQHAEADLTDIMPGGPDDHFRFERVIRRSGLEPRPFDHNGNIVKFAVGESELSPREILAYFQKQFKNEGINSQVYTKGIIHPLGSDEENEKIFSNEENAKRNTALLRGEVVPTLITDNLISMGSFIPKVKAKNAGEIAEKWLHDAEGPFSIDANHGGFRSIEARREADTGKSTITATWTDRDFDIKKAQGIARAGASPDTEIPVCPGCERLNRIKGLSKEDPYTLNQISARGSVDTNYQFFSAALAQRGWIESDTQTALDEMSRHIPDLAQLWRQGEFVSFENSDGETMNLFITTDPNGRTSVVTLQGHKGN